MKRRFFTAACAVLALLLLGLSIYLFWRSAQIGGEIPPDPSFLVPASPSSSPAPTPTPTPEPAESETPAPTPDAPVETSPAIEDDGLPHDKLFITVERQHYEDGGLQLIIPKLEVDVSIMDGVDADTLLRGEGLYDYAQLPSETNANTSIAGHRNWIRGGKLTLDQAFSYLDRLEEGDYIYLRDDTNIYQYVFEYQETVKPTDWGPIYKADHTCVTLTTCTPVGVSDHRLIVRGQLVDTIPYSEDYDYPATNKEADTQ